MTAIKMAFGLAKGAVSSFDTGGFTPGGNWNEPQGIVHSNEFVANRFAVKNPQVLPVLQRIDAAQRDGSISHLTGKEIADVTSNSAHNGETGRTTENELPQAPETSSATKVIESAQRIENYTLLTEKEEQTIRPEASAEEKDRTEGNEPASVMTPNFPIMRLIQSAQRSGSISHLTGNDIAAVASGGAPASMPAVSIPASQTQAQPIDLSPLYVMLGRLERVMDRATEAYQEPSPAYCYVNGRGGIEEAQKLNETINRNASLK